MSTYSAKMSLIDNISSTATKMQNSMKRLQGSISKVGNSFSGLGTILAGGALVMGLNKLKNAYLEQESSNIKASQSAYAFGQTMGYTQEQIDDLYNTMQGNAGKIQDNGIFGDEALLNAQSMALQMGFNKEQMTELTKASADMTAKQKGAQATGEDLLATQKALTADIKNGTTKSFRTLGLSLDENTKATLKGMTEQERYAFILNKVREASEGADENIRKSTVGGRLTGIANNLGDVTQEVARLVLGFSSFDGNVPSWLASLDDMLKDFKNNLASCSTPLDGIILAFNTLHEKAPVLTDIAMGILTIVAGFKAYQLAVQLATTAQTVFNAICGLNPIALTIIGAIAVFTILTSILDSFGITWGDVWDGCVNVFNSVCDSIKSGFKSAVNFVKGIWNTLVDFFGTVMDNSPLGILVNGLLSLAGSTVTVKQVVDNAKTSEHNALGTSYFGGGLTHINERNAGEIVNLPSGTQIIPHDIAEKQANTGNVFNINVNVQGNMIGNEEYTNELGNALFNKLQFAINNM